MNELFTYCLDADCNKITDVSFSEIETSLDEFEENNRMDELFLHHLDEDSNKISEVSFSKFEDYLERFMWM